MQYVSGNIGPELTKHVPQGIASQGGCVSRSQPFACVPLVRIVAGSNAGCDGGTEGLGSIERVDAVVFVRNKSASRGIRSALPKASLAKGTVVPTL